MEEGTRSARLGRAGRGFFGWRIACAILLIGMSSSAGWAQGDDVLKGECAPEATPGEAAYVIEAIAAVHGPEAAQRFSDDLAAGKFKLVKVQKAGTHDATTIGLDLSRPRLMLGLAAWHEHRHWTRAAAAAASAPSGPIADSLIDPTTDIDQDDDGEVDNECGPLNHANEGLFDMQELFEVLCDPATPPAEVREICKDWWDMNQRIKRLYLEAQRLQCPEAQLPLTETPWLDVPKPPCCI